MNEYLQVRDRAETAIVECRGCGTTVCDADANWKEHVVVRRSDPRVAGPLRSEGGPFFLLEFFCPGCGTLLEVESAFENDPPLHDTIDDWGWQS